MLGLGSLIAKAAAVAVIPRVIQALSALGGPTEPVRANPSEPTPETVSAPVQQSEKLLYKKNQLTDHNYRYSTYGERTKVGGDLDSDFGFGGLFHHEPSGLDLATYRTYDSKMGRWISRDPLGEGVDYNLYRYCGNNPISCVDPSGLEPPPWVNAWLSTLDAAATAAGTYYGGQAGGAAGFTFGAGAGAATGPGAAVASPGLGAAGAAIGTVAGAAAGGTAAHAGAQIFGALVRGGYNMFSEGQDAQDQYTGISGRKRKLDRGKNKCKNEDGEGANFGDKVIDSVEKSRQEASEALKRLRGKVKDAIKSWED